MSHSEATEDVFTHGRNDVYIPPISYITNVIGKTFIRVHASSVAVKDDTV